MKVLSISEVHHTISFKYQILLEWFENRAKFYNLKQNEALNILSSQEMEYIWIPYIIFQNTDNNEAVSIKDTKSNIFVTREGDFVRSGVEFTDEIEIFQGNENRLTMVQTYSKKFHCTYLLHWFPFDTQVLHTLNKKF